MTHPWKFFTERSFTDDELRAVHSTGKSDADIAKQFGCTATSVWKHRTRLGLQSPPSPQRNTGVASKVREMIGQGGSNADIARAVGCSASNVRSIRARMANPPTPKPRVYRFRRGATWIDDPIGFDDQEDVRR